MLPCNRTSNIVTKHNLGNVFPCVSMTQSWILSQSSQVLRELTVPKEYKKAQAKLPLKRTSNLSLPRHSPVIKSILQRQLRRSFCPLEQPARQRWQRLGKSAFLQQSQWNVNSKTELWWTSIMTRFGGLFGNSVLPFLESWLMICVKASWSIRVLLHRKIVHIVLVSQWREKQCSQCSLIMSTGSTAHGIS